MLSVIVDFLGKLSIIRAQPSLIMWIFLFIVILLIIVCIISMLKKRYIFFLISSSLLLWLIIDIIRFALQLKNK